MSQKKAKLDLVFVLFYKLLSYNEIFATYQGSEKYLYDVYLYVIYTNLTLWSTDSENCLNINSPIAVQFLLSKEIP